MYKYETHLHTKPVSKCGRATVEESLVFYKEQGYDGVFITNHFLDGDVNIEYSRPYEEKLDFYFSDYEAALVIGEKLGLKVFCGQELSYKGTDFLVYGLDKQWYLEHPEIMDMRKSQELALMRECGALVVQAHPFREAGYIDHIRLFPRQCDGVEVVNATRSDFQNEMAEKFADHYGLLKLAGSDNHRGPNQKKQAGICCEEPICSVADFIERVKAGKTQIFTAEQD